MAKQVRVVSSIADANNLVLYLEDGQVVTIPQGDPRVAKLVEDLIPFYARGEVAVVDLDNYSIYNEFSESTGGIISFFKVAKEKVKNFFGFGTKAEEPEQETPAPVVQAKAAQATEEVKAIIAKVETKPAAPTVDEVLAEAVAMDNNDLVDHDQTVVAVVKTSNGDKIIPGAQALKEQFTHANKNKNPAGVANLMKRMAEMVGTERGHSVEDLLRFLEGGDLPVADDGSIIAYKVLNKKADGTMVDCHSGKVKQRVGSLVIVDESLVDKNRKNECSNGLHIARRGYIRSFVSSGNVCVLCKIRPEDVITVPHGDARKVRVCAYQILDVLPEKAFNEVSVNRPMTGDWEASAMLANALAGRYPEPIEEVRITAQMGEGLKITPMVNGKKVAKAPSTNISKEELSKAKAFDDDASKVKTSVDVKDINKKMAAEEAKVAEADPQKANAFFGKKSAGPTNKDLAKTLYEQMIDENLSVVERKKNAKALKVLKSKAKVSYEKLGLPAHTAGRIEAVLSPEFEVNFKKIQEQEAKAQTKAEPAKQAELPKDETKPVIIWEGSNKEKARAMYQGHAWDELVALKKKTKQSWAGLGFSRKEEDEIVANIK